MCPQTTSLSFPFSSVLSNHKLKPKQEHKADRILTHNTFGLRLCVSSFYGIFMRYYLITLETPNNHPWRRPTFYKYLFVFIYLSVLGLSCGSQIFSYGMWDLVSCVCVCVCVWAQTLSRVQLFAIPWTVACQTCLSSGFSRQEYWSGLPFPSPGDLPYPGIQPESLVSPAMAGRFFTTIDT